MRYTCETTIDLPRERVIELFDSTENMYKWQDGLVSFDAIEGAPGQVGAKSRLKYKMGKREIEMVETITERDFPERFSGTYEAKGVWNVVENTFTDQGEGRTGWRIDTEFRCSGLMKVFAFLMPGAFKKQTAKMQSDFKAFAENA